MPNETILCLENVSKRYDLGGRALDVLNDISLSIKRGSTCALIGPSGSGKTTLLGLCAGLDRVSAGSIRLDNDALEGMTEDALARLRTSRVGFVFQSFQLLPTLTALENVMVPLELAGNDSPKQAAQALLEQVGLEERTGHYPLQLSGGEQQRVAIARAYINHPDILFADEPTGNLDADTGEQIIDLLFELHQENGTTLVMATHNLELAERMNRRIRLRSGRIVEDVESGEVP